MNKDVVDYVKKFFDTHFEFYLDKFTMAEIEELMYGVARDIYKKFSVDQIKQGKIDAIIQGAINEFIEYKLPGVKADKVNFENYTRNWINSNNVVQYSDETCKYLVDIIVSRLIQSYTYDDLMNGKADSAMELIYESVIEDLRTRIAGYVKSYLINSIMPLVNINEAEIAEKIVNAIMNGNKYNAPDLFVGKYDGIIENSALHYEQEAKKKRPNSSEYIFKIILNEDETLEDYVIHAYVSRIEEVLRSRGLHASDIVSGKYDTEIVNMYRRMSMRNNSVKTEAVSKKVPNKNGVNPNKIKHTTKKRRMSFYQRNLIVLALVASLGLGGLGYMFGLVSDGINNNNAKQTVNSFDGYSYTLIHTKYTDAYKPTALNVLDFYDKVNEYGNNNYDCLGFYRAYSHVVDNRLAIMDSMLSLVKSYARNDANYAGLYQLIGDNSCYVEFAYDRLVDMGCEKIQDEKYLDAISAYKTAKREANEDQVPFNLMSKKDQKLIEEIMEMYRDYSEQCLVEFGNMLEEADDTTLVSCQVQGSGRRA